MHDAPKILMEDTFAKSFLLRGPPFIGECRFKDKDVVKANGGRWNGDVKKWEARTVEDLEKMLKCKLWLPSGITEDGVKSILCAIHCQKGAPKRPQPNELHFDRRHPKRSKFDEKTDKWTIGGHTRIFARPCEKCGILLDSSLQFGMECDCKDGFVWEACVKCMRPLRQREMCECKNPRNHGFTAKFR